MPELLKTALVIPTFNREEALEYTLRGILSVKHNYDELIVVDQTDRHTPRVEKFLTEQRNAGRLRLLRSSPPNLNGARNCALENTDCEIAIFIDDDVALSPGFVDAHRANYAQADVAAVAGRTLQAQGYWVKIKNGGWPPQLDYVYRRLDGTERIESIANFIGCNHSVRTSFARDRGGYDEQYIGTQRDESDMAMRIWKAGGRIVFDPEAELLHYAYSSGGVRPDRKQPQWISSNPFHLYSWRHIYPSAQFWNEFLFVHFRRLVLTKRNLTRPWRLPGALAAYLNSFYRAWRTARTGVILNTKARGEKRA